MAAKRKYTDPQRQAIWRLHEAGNSATEIERLCKEGLASVEAFSIPRRSVSQILGEMEAEANQRAPKSVTDPELAAAVNGFPERISRIVDAELARLETKAAKGTGLSIDDLDRLKKASTLSTTLAKQISQVRKRKVLSHGPSPEPPKESTFERIAREDADSLKKWREDQQKAAGVEVQPSRTHTHHATPQSAPIADQDDHRNTPRSTPASGSPEDTESEADRRRAARSAEIARRSRQPVA